MKKRFFKHTTDATTGDTSYSPFADVNGNGSILANDYSEVKKRFFQTLPQPDALAPAAASSTPLTGSSVTKDLFSGGAILA